MYGLFHSSITLEILLFLLIDAFRKWDAMFPILKVADSHKAPVRGFCSKWTIPHVIRNPCPKTYIANCGFNNFKRSELSYRFSYFKRLGFFWCMGIELQYTCVKSILQLHLLTIHFPYMKTFPITQSLVAILGRVKLKSPLK